MGASSPPPRQSASSAAELYIHLNYLPLGGKRAHIMEILVWPNHRHTLSHAHTRRCTAAQIFIFTSKPHLLFIISLCWFFSHLLDAYCMWSAPPLWLSACSILFWSCEFRMVFFSPSLFFPHLCDSCLLHLLFLDLTLFVCFVPQSKSCFTSCPWKVCD